jgi:hypothetical protein
LHQEVQKVLAREDDHFLFSGQQKKRFFKNSLFYRLVSPQLQEASVLRHALAVRALLHWHTHGDIKRNKENDCADLERMDKG